MGFSYLLDSTPDSASTTTSVVLLIVGLFECFFGYKLRKVSFFVFGFVVAFMITSSAISELTDNNDIIFGCSVTVGLISAIFALCFLSVGPMFVGFFAGVLLAYMAYITVLHYISTSNYLAFYIPAAVFGLIGIFLAYKISHIVLLVTTAFGGSFLFLRSIDRLANSQISLNDVENGNLSPEGWALVSAIVVLGTIGVLFQGKFFCFKKSRVHLTRPLLSSK
eukprot:c13292_g1_i1.p1 GENE.c13292_g1_i1~~c13292_g1_i1.p1  ORF type:complete len:222 (+),score=72.66 c13292_g1_i1:45-710(+)